MKGLIAVLVSLAFLTSAAQAANTCQPDQVKTKYPQLAGKTINVAQDGLQPPFSFRDEKNPDKVIGVDVDLATETFKCIGVPWKLNLGVWAGLITSVTQGRNDIMWDTLNYTPERAKQVDYVLYLSAATGFIVKKGNPKHVTSLETVCGTVAAAGLGTVEEAAFHDLGRKCVAKGKPDIKIVTYTDPSAGLREVENGRVDVIMTDLTLSQIVIAKNPSAIELAFHILSGFHVGVAVNKGETQLRQAIYDALKILQANGTEKKILVKYHVDPSLQYPAEIKTH